MGHRIDRGRSASAALGLLAFALLWAHAPSASAATPTLTVTKVGTGTGTVISSPAGIECGPTCSFAFAEGAAVTLTGSPGANTEAVKWTGCASVSEGKCLVTMSAAKSVTATFNLGKRELKVTKKGAGAGTVTSSPAGISCGATCSFVFNQGTTVTLTGTPSGEAQAPKWTGCDSVNAENKCIVAMSAAREVAATFNLPTYTLTVAKLGNGAGTVTSSPAGIACGETCSEGFPKGQTVTLTGAPGLHAKAVKWSGCDSVTKEGKCVVAMTSAKTVIATFALERQWTEYMVTAQRKGAGKGTVTSAPAGIDCGEDCSQAYLYDTQLTLTAVPAEGSVFKEWSGGGCLGQTGPCTTAVTGARLIRAIFVAVGNRTLTVAKAGTGQGTVISKAAGIDCGLVCSAGLDASTRVSLHATAAPGSTFAGWSGEGCTGTAACRVLMNEARNVTATFTQTPAPPPARCRVPRLTGKTLAKARAALSAANCVLGKVRRPKGAKKPAGLRVRASSPSAGAVLAAGSKVGVRLGPAKR